MFNRHDGVLPGPSNHMSAALGMKKWKTNWKKTKVDENGNAVRKEEGHVKTDEQKIRHKNIREAKFR